MDSSSAAASKTVSIFFIVVFISLFVFKPTCIIEEKSGKVNGNEKENGGEKSFFPSKNYGFPNPMQGRIGSARFRMGPALAGEPAITLGCRRADDIRPYIFLAFPNFLGEIACFYCSVPFPCSFLGNGAGEPCLRFESVVPPLFSQFSQLTAQLTAGFAGSCR
ncbi:MAG: hypothetical protein IJ189_00535 [Clostridia bacterium]|nr:hypothetical protein [Clostridia bacterium]